MQRQPRDLDNDQRRFEVGAHVRFSFFGVCFFLGGGGAGAIVCPSVRNRVKLFFFGGGGSLSETFSWVQQRPSARPSIIMLF